MENFYRDGLAKELKDTRNIGEEGKELAKDLLGEVKKTDQYTEEKERHIQDNLDERNPDSQKNIQARAESVREEIQALKKNKEFNEKPEKLRNLEQGPLFKLVDWHKAQDIIRETNANLKESEKPWRMMTKEEFEIVYEELKMATAELEKEYLTGNSDDRGLEYRKYQERVTLEFGKIMSKYGLATSYYYWTSTECDSGTAYAFFPNHGFEPNGKGEQQYDVSLVR